MTTIRDANSPDARATHRAIKSKEEVAGSSPWTGEWVRDKDGKAVDCECHYVLTKGIIYYDNSSTHSLRGQKIPLPVLPPFLHD